MAVKKFLRVYKEKARQNVSNIVNMIAYGEALMKIEKYEKAEKAFKRAYRLDPKNLRVLENLYSIVFAQNAKITDRKAKNFLPYKDLSLPPLVYHKRYVQSPNRFYVLSEKKDIDSSTSSRNRFRPLKQNTNNNMSFI